jgi:hypothetical protein
MPCSHPTMTRFKIRKQKIAISAVFSDTKRKKDEVLSSDYCPQR